MSSLVAYISSTSSEEGEDEGAEEEFSHSHASVSWERGGKDTSLYIDEAAAEVATNTEGQCETLETATECERKVGGAYDLMSI